MLIIVSGVQTLNIRAIANEIFFAFNTFKVGDYTVTFRSRNFKIEDSSGATVYASSFPGVEDTLSLFLNEDGSIDEAGYEVFNSVQPLLDTLLEDQSTLHYSAKFAEDVLYDYGCREFSESEISWPGLFESIVDKYNAKTYNTMVISGGFSKYVIDKLKETLGSENVTAVNIIRNPSAAYICNLRSPDFYAENPGEKENHEKRLNLSLLNAVNLARFSDIEIHKFEDMLAQNSITIVGTSAALPGEYIAANEYVTEYELTLIQPESSELDAELNNFNTVLQSFNDLSTKNDLEPDQNTVALINEKLPTSLFTELGYSPLTYTQVTAKL